MKLGRKDLALVSFMLFSLFFGAGNLIFPPYLGQSAGTNMPVALLGFLATAVVLPVLGVVVVAKFDGIDRLAGQVGSRFASVFSILIYVSIGLGLGIPRAASVPFEMAVAPYLPQGVREGWFMLCYSLVFFLIALWLCLNPEKLVSRIGNVLTPALLALIGFLFVSFLAHGEVAVSDALGAYRDAPFQKGFTEGYNTMDTIAALNFGLVISTTLGSFGLSDVRDRMRYTVLAGLLAGTILATVYIMLSFMGMCSSGVYALAENGAWTLRHIVYQLFGEVGAVLLAAIFTLACLTTCVGLINSISQYFSMRFSRLSYRAWVCVITAFSFGVCNLGLDAILSISIPVLSAIYPVSIVLILLGLTHDAWKCHALVYPLTIGATAFVSVLTVLADSKLLPSALCALLQKLPLSETGFSWIIATVTMLVIALLIPTKTSTMRSE